MFLERMEKRAAKNYVPDGLVSNYNAPPWHRINVPAASFKHSFLSVDVYVCMSLCRPMYVLMSSSLRLNISETKGDSGFFPLGARVYRKVPKCSLVVVTCWVERSRYQWHHAIVWRRTGDIMQHSYYVAYGLVSSDVKWGQNLEAEVEARAIWPWGHFGLEDLTSLFVSSNFLGAMAARWSVRRRPTSTSGQRARAVWLITCQLKKVNNRL